MSVRVPSHCPRCEARVGPAAWLHPPETFQSHGPFPALFRKRDCLCPMCGVRIVAAAGDFQPNEVSVWTKGWQQLDEGIDYQVLRRGHAALLSGRIPIRVAWWWTPLVNDLDFNEQIACKLETDQLWGSRSAASLLIYGPGVDTTWAFKAKHTFDEVWQLKSRVLDGAVGPFPSVRAELSIVHTFAGRGLERVAHFWPGATLPSQSYIPLARDEELARAWGEYRLMHLSLKVEHRT